jgi:(1->4)-alpha-D-glucan 1-alpha-D-glucosylmutase
MTPPQPLRHPVSTYRLQFRREFGFRQAEELVPYLDALGISDCYSSPHFMANPGSTHGYDICNHSALNPELGSDDEYRAFCGALRARGLGHLVDVVPNHMAADPRSNPWWRDVLENGPSSPFADYFDIDWDPIKPELRGKVLLPVLGDQYGRALERGELQVRFEDGALHLAYFDLDLPINPRQAPKIFALDLPRLEEELAGQPDLREYLSAVTALQHLPPASERDPARIAERQREKEVARERLARLAGASPPIRRHIESAVRRTNGTSGDPGSFDILHDLLESQAYRLAYWRTAADEINYRRFFDINELVALRMERQDVFDATHVLVKQLIERGDVTGLRVDHPDGLFDPAAYFDRLQELAGGSFYVVAEKILALGEGLPENWRVAGTTGYGFLNEVSGLFIDGRQIRKLRRIYTRVTGRTESFDVVSYRSRLAVMLTAMASELNVLAHALNRLSETDRRTRDFTLNSCRRALREIAACFPVYRVYPSRRGVTRRDRDVVTRAVAEARRRNPLMEDSTFDFLAGMLLPDPAGTTEAPSPDDQERQRFAMRVPQFTAPVQAKGIEDTAFYRYHVLVSANDVGGRPAHPNVTPEEFHAANRRRRDHWPYELLATSTHDTKRGEDARARINVLSELPDQWQARVAEWMRVNGRYRTRVEGAWAPERNDEYLFYQSLVGVWPAAAGTETPTDEFVERLATYMEKAIREAKVHTSWTDENPEYGPAVRRFVVGCLTGDTAPRFLETFVPFAWRVAAAGMVNSLAQLVLKIASPGVPDFYQGTELWDLTLVDPDNRRPVDLSLRQTLLQSLSPLIERVERGEDCADRVGELLRTWQDGAIKLFVTACGLRARRRDPELFLHGRYQSLPIDGPRSDHLVAFARIVDGRTLVVVAPRFTLSLSRDEGPPVGERVWESTRVMLPAPARFLNVVTGERIEAAEGGLPVGSALATIPVGLLLADTSRRIDRGTPGMRTGA